MNDKIAIIGLGYVGLPLAIEFSKKYHTIGFDINEQRINELKNNYDKTLEINDIELKNTRCIFTSDLSLLRDVNIYIITVPTPIDRHNRPDFNPLIKASLTVGKVLKINDIVIYESTVYPGATEEVCVPLLEKESGLKYNSDFFCGYSPERINPGDKEHTLTKILKVTSGSTPDTAQRVNNLYKSIITAGTHLAPSIKVAEAAKVIENSQRDINIAFVNELAIIFNKLGINTDAVLEAAGTKWNFLKFKPGLVGGHCIGVDPYYLTHKAQEVGYHPEIILAGRRLNDKMGIYIANQVIKSMIKKGHKIEGAEVLVLGITFKENCPDIRNSKVIDLINELKEFGCIVDSHDPWADFEDVKKEYNISLIEDIEKKYDAIILAVSHSKFKEINLLKNKKENSIIFDIKSFLPQSIADERL